MRCLERYGGRIATLMIVALLSTVLSAAASTRVHVYTASSDIVTEDSKARDVDRLVIEKRLAGDKNLVLVSNPADADFTVEVLSRGQADQSVLTNAEKLMDQRYVMVRAVIRRSGVEVPVERQSPYYSMAGINVADAVRQFARDNGQRFASRE